MYLSRLNSFSFLMCLMIASVGTSGAAEPLSLSFDGRISAAIGQQSWPVEFDGIQQYGQGRKGQSLRVGGQYGRIKIPVGSFVSAEQGTIMLWIKPVDWRANDQHYHVFFEVSGRPDGQILLYKNSDGGRTLALTSRPSISEGNILIGRDVSWVPGQWHHLALTWSGKGIFVYVDGESLFDKPMRVLLPAALGGALFIGDNDWGHGRQSSSFIDELQIYPFQLSSESVRSAYRVDGYEVTMAERLEDDYLKANVVNPLISKNNTVKLQVNYSGHTNVRPLRIILDKDELRMALDKGLTLLRQPKLSVIRDGHSLSLNEKIVRLSEGSALARQTFLGKGIHLSLLYRKSEDGALTVTLEPHNNSFGRDDELMLTFSINPDLLKYLHEGGPSWTTHYSEFSSGSLNRNLSYLPFLWFGNDGNGLFWYCNSSRNWPNADSNEAIQFKKNGTNSHMTLLIKKAGQVWVDHGAIEMGFFSTGVGDSNYEKVDKLRLAPGKNSNLAIIWPDSSKKEFLYYGYPEVASGNLLRSAVTSLQQVGQRAAPYLTPTFVSTHWPNWSSQEESLWMGNYDSNSIDVVSWKAPLAQVYPADTWADEFSSKTNEFLQKLSAKAVYFDNVQMYGAGYLPLSYGYFRNNRIVPEYPRTQYLKLFSKVAEAAHQADDVLTIFHTSGQSDPMILQYADYFVSGEEYRGMVNGSYLKTLPLSTWRTEFSTRQWGAKPIIIPEFNEADSKAEKPTRELMGLVLLHNVAIWPIWSNVRVIDGIYSLFDREVHSHASFRRYDYQGDIRANSDKIKVSLYDQDANRSIAVVFNSGNQADADICASTWHLVEARDIELKRGRMVLENNCFKLHLYEGEFTMIALTH